MSGLLPPPYYDDSRPEARLVEPLMASLNNLKLGKKGSCISLLNLIAKVAMIGIFSAAITGKLSTLQFAYGAMSAGGVYLLSEEIMYKRELGEGYKTHHIIISSLFTTSIYILLPALTINNMIPAQLLGKVLLGVFFARAAVACPLLCHALCRSQKKSSAGTS